MEPIVISDHSISRSKKSSGNSCGCCCLGRSSSTISINNTSQSQNKQYEYVVEKLVIKRVPVKSKRHSHEDSHSEHNSDEEQVPPRKYLECNAMDPLDSTSIREPKPPIVFSSYCQLSPRQYLEDQRRLRNPGFTNEKLCSPAETHQSKGPNHTFFKNPNIANLRTGPKSPLTISKDRDKELVPIHLPQTHKSPGQNKTGSPSFTRKPPNASTMIIDAAMKETLEMLARKRSADYRFFKSCGHDIIMKDTSSSDLPLKLQDVYYNTSESSKEMKARKPKHFEPAAAGDIEHKSNRKQLISKKSSDFQTNNKEVKWKIIVRQKKDNFASNNSGNFDTDFFSEPSTSE